MTLRDATSALSCGASHARSFVFKSPPPCSGLAMQTMSCAAAGLRPSAATRRRRGASRPLRSREACHVERSQLLRRGHARRRRRRGLPRLRHRRRRRAEFPCNGRPGAVHLPAQPRGLNMQRARRRDIQDARQDASQVAQKADVGRNELDPKQLTPAQPAHLRKRRCQRASRRGQGRRAAEARTERAVQGARISVTDDGRTGRWSPKTTSPVPRAFHTTLSANSTALKPTAQART